MQLRSGVAVVVVQAPAVALIPPLAWEVPYDTGATIQTSKQTNKNAKSLSLLVTTLKAA